MESKKQSGFTLVELIVSFAVLSILLGAVAVLLPSFLNQYNHVQSTSRTQTIGNTLMEMIEGQLSYATSSINLNTVDNNGFTIVEYNDQDGNAVYMSVLTDAFKTKYGSENKLSNDLFVLRYSEASDSGNAGLVSRQAIDWGYTDDFYLTNKVTAFTVSKAPSEYRENVLEVSFTLTNSKNGMENKFTRLVECTNFASTTDNDITIDGKDPSGGGSIFIPDSTGRLHEFKATLDWEEVKKEIIKDGWHTVNGGILTDGKNFYLCSNWSQFVQKESGDITLEYIVNKYPSYFLKLETTTKLWIESDRYVKPNGAGTVWKPCPQKGDLCYFGNKYYVAPSSIGEYTFPPGGWIEILR